jgi:hypothetical protein
MQKTFVSKGGCQFLGEENQLLEMSSVLRCKVDLMVGCMLPLSILLCLVRISILGAPQRPLGIGPESLLISNQMRAKVVQLP